MLRCMSHPVLGAVKSLLVGETSHFALDFLLFLILLIVILSTADARRKFSIFKDSLEKLTLNRLNLMLQ